MLKELELCMELVDPRDTVDLRNSIVSTEPYPAPSKLKIITYTITVNIGTPIDIIQFAERFPLKKNRTLGVKVKRKDGTVLKRCVEGYVMTDKLFQNQATLVVCTKDCKKINTKVFLNGGLQMTGCREMEDAIYCAEFIVKTLQMKKYMRVLAEPANLRIVNYTICMINSKFSCNFSFDRQKLAVLLRTRYSQFITQVMFDERSYQGVNIKHLTASREKATILAFRNGKILITGVKSERALAESYEFINNVLREHHLDLFSGRT